MRPLPAAALLRLALLSHVRGGWIVGYAAEQLEPCHPPPRGSPVERGTAIPHLLGARLFGGQPGRPAFLDYVRLFDAVMDTDLPPLRVSEMVQKLKFLDRLPSCEAVLTPAADGVSKPNKRVWRQRDPPRQPESSLSGSEEVYLKGRHPETTGLPHDQTVPLRECCTPSGRVGV